MEIIDELEPVRRGAYCGAVGWLGRNGAADLSVAIRIAVAVGDRVSCHVGGGITWPSDPAEEYAETLAKGAPLLRGLGGGGPV
jgi:para-aminobenzoate synthetase component 1